MTLGEREEGVMDGGAKRDGPAGLPLGPLKRLDVPFMILAALISLDMVGQISTFGGQTFTMLIVMAVLWMVPYGLITAELGSAFPGEGGLYIWVKLAFGRLPACLATMLYWSINPIWIGGSLAFLSVEAWNGYIHPVTPGSLGDLGFKTIFVLVTFIITVLPLERSIILFRIGACLKLVLTAAFISSTLIYGALSGFRGAGVNAMTPTMMGFLGLAPLLVFSLSGFEVPSQAGGGLRNPQRDIPRGVGLSGVIGVLAYALPMLSLFLVLPPASITGISGFMSAVAMVLGVYGRFAPILLGGAVIAFIACLMITGAAWATAANRTLAVAAADGAFFSAFGKVERRTGVPLRVSGLGTVVALLFMAAGTIFSQGDSEATFKVVLSIATSTFLLTLLFVFPAAVRLRLRYPRVARPYAVPGGLAGMGVAAALAMFWAILGSWSAILPGSLEYILGFQYAFEENWGVSRLRFEVFTLGTLALLIVIALLGYMNNMRISLLGGRRSSVTI
ncbi:APC family permease [Sphingomonas sp. SORGH_AS_0879]|uniref:APC family permease n=1 Tax=Sphingomonas sp. SORGH_AS_0879 TaxID=3041790 RepID=UPI00278963A3|nr:APC family permease [Sphingomonas sp. SORGH_AS_0879]MDQ1231872.1 amino acid transporter [Sphingomonas sp. SORGH_AS_0879]